MTRANRIKELSDIARCNAPSGAAQLMESVRDLEKLEKIEALVNEPVNRAVGSVSIKAIREVLNG